MLYIFLTAFILIQSFILLFSESSLGFGGLKNITNYHVAKYSIKHPELFFSRFENPLYTMLLTPFAQFGYLAAKAFNLLIAVSTLILTAGIVKRLYDGRLVIIVLILSAFSPVYFQMSISSLPEILFGFILIAAIYLFILERHLWSSLIISFIVLVAPEGMVILPIFFFAFILTKSFKAIPLLISGIFVYSIAGYFMVDDYLLLFQNLTGKISQADEDIAYMPFSAIGIFLYFLTIAGLLFWLYEIIRRRWNCDSNLNHFILIAGSFVVYHTVSYLWLSKSQIEFIRVTGALIPLMALTSLRAIEFIRRKVKEKKIFAGILLVIVTGHIFLLFLQTDILKKATPEEQLMKKAASYLQHNEQGSKLFHINSLLVHYLQLDPFSEWWSNLDPDEDQPSKHMDWGDILVWYPQTENDSVGLNLTDLQNDSNLVRIISFSATDIIKNANKKDYQLHLYKKEKQQDHATEVTDYYNSVLDFDIYQDKRVKNKEGIKAWELDSTQEYSPSIRITPGVVVKKHFYEFTAMVYYQALQPIKASEVLLVYSIELDGKSLYYNTEYLISSGGSWEELKLNGIIPSDFPDSANVLVYLWNIKRKQILIDKISLDIKSY